MKKTIYIIMILLLLTGCNKNMTNANIDKTNNEPVKDIPSTPPTPTYIDKNPIIVGLYQNGKLVKDINVTIRNAEDIGSFDVYFTNESDVGGTNTKNNFNKYLNNYENTNKYKIGFYIYYETLNGKKEATILGPGEYKVAPYIYTYLYDDIHQPDGAWYSHVEENQVKEDTIYSSIKLYAAERTNEITSPITLTVFTYDGLDDFDEEGKYRGDSKYTININKI